MKKPYYNPDELLEDALPLYAVADGRKTRSMIDAVRDAMYENGDRENYSMWADVLKALDEAVGKTKILDNGFQFWEREKGRTIEECRAAFKRAIPIARRNAKKKEEADFNRRRCYC